MKITFLGTGTSTGCPLIGCDCEACTSTDWHDKRLRTSAFIEVDGLNLLIDIGPDFRQQMLRAKVKRIDAVLITHAHNDHVAGLDDIRAFNFLQKKAIPIYTDRIVIDNLKERFGYIFAESAYPGVPRVEIHEIHKDKPFPINDLTITPISVLHGRLPILGFRIKDFTYITDIKTISEKELEKVKGTELLVLSALHFGKHFSHLNIEEAIALAQRIQPRQTFLTHISHRMGLYADVEPNLPKKINLAYDELVVAMD